MLSIHAGNQDFYMNFMEDTDDNSKCMLTVGQMNRMLEYLVVTKQVIQFFPRVALMIIMTGQFTLSQV